MRGRGGDASRAALTGPPWAWQSQSARTTRTRLRGWVAAAVGGSRADSARWAAPGSAASRAAQSASNAARSGSLRGAEARSLSLEVVHAVATHWLDYRNAGEAREQTMTTVAGARLAS